MYHSSPKRSQIATFMGPTWGPPGSCRPQMGPMLDPRTLRSGVSFVRSVSDLRSMVVTAFLYSSSCSTGPCYNGAYLFINSSSTSDAMCQGTHHWLEQRFLGTKPLCKILLISQRRLIHIYNDTPAIFVQENLQYCGDFIWVFLSIWESFMGPLT